MQTHSPTYLQAQEAWRTERAQRLQTPDSWLSLAGLFWLQEGENTIGTAPDSDVVLPEGTGPEQLGIIRLDASSTSIQTTSGLEVNINGTPTTQSLLQADKTGQPDKVTLGQLSFIVIKRGERYGVRLWDNTQLESLKFSGLDWFPLQDSYRIRAEFVPHPAPISLPIMTQTGDLEESVSPGYVVFQFHGQEYRLVAESKKLDEYLFFNFKDLTNGTQTYGAGRFLTTEGVSNGEVLLDFNRATNPYCAYTDYATCPLAPKENYLKVAIEAGEKKYR